MFPCLRYNIHFCKFDINCIVDIEKDEATFRPQETAASFDLSTRKVC